MEVTLYTRRDCPLCDEAKATLRAAGLEPKEVDIDRDPELQRRFTNDVPVIYIDGKEAFRHRVSAEQLAPFALAGEKCVLRHSNLLQQGLDRAARRRGSLATLDGVV